MSTMCVCVLLVEGVKRRLPAVVKTGASRGRCWGELDTRALYKVLKHPGDALY